MASVLRGTIDFLNDFGLFDVILPFLLIFAIVFAILEKTFILGKEKDGSPKQNLDSIVALAIALIFVSANKAVNILTDALPNIALVTVVLVSFLLMLGIFWKSEEFDFREKEKSFYIIFSILVFVALVFVFLGAIEHESGGNLLSYVFGSIGSGISTDWVVGGIVFLVLIGVIVYVVRKPKEAES